MRVLFVCTANSCRSQMAEAWARHLFPSDWDAASAGLLTYPISRRTRAVMQEAGLDMAGQQPKTIDEVELDSFDLVVTLSEDAGRYLPRLQEPGRHWTRPIPDPMAVEGTVEAVRAAFRKGRDQTRAIVEEVLRTRGDRSGSDPLSIAD